MRSWKHNIFANLLGSAAGPLFSFLFTPIYIRFLGIESYALVTFFLTLVSMTFVLDQTFGATINRAMAQTNFNARGPDESRDLARSIELIYVGVSITMATICILSSPWIARHWLNVMTLPLGSVSTSIAMMGVCVALQAPVSLYTGGLYGLERQPLFNALSIALGATRGCGAIAAMWLIAPTTIVYFGWQMAFSVLQLGCLGVAFWRSMPAGTRRPRFSVPVLRGVAGFAAGVAGAGLMTFLLYQINSILLSRLLPLPRFGIFQIASQVNNGARLLGQPIASTAFPRFSYHSGAMDDLSLGKVYHDACQIMAVLVLPASSMIVFFSYGVLKAWLGNIHIATEAAPVVVALVCGTTLSSLFWPQYQVTLAKGWSMYGFYQNLAAVILFVPVLVYLAYTYGMLGAAYSWLILNVCYVAICAPIIHHYVLRGHYVRWMLEDFLLPLVTATAFAFALRLVMPEHLSRAGFIAAFAAGCGANVLICAAVLPRTREVLLRISKRIIARIVRV